MAPNIQYYERIPNVMFCNYFFRHKMLREMRGLKRRVCDLERNEEDRREHERMKRKMGFASQPSSSRAICPVCSCSMPLTKAGLFRVHGPLSNRCEGSGISLSSRSATSSRLSLLLSLSSPSSHADASTASTTPLGFNPSSILLSSDLHQYIRLLKRIPRASRHLLQPEN